MIGLYRILNRANSHYYVGSTVDSANRWRHHRNALRKNKHYNDHLQRAWNKYGEATFVFEITQEFSCGITLLELKTEEGKLLDSVVGLSECYNISKDPLAPTRGLKISEETKQKRSLALKGQKRTPEQIEYNRQAVSEWNNRRRTAGIPHPNAGRKMSDEQKEKMRLINTGRKHNQTFRDKVSQQWKGKLKSEEQKRKISESEKRTKSK